MSITIEYLWQDRQRYFGLPLSFTRYALSEDRLFTSVGFLNIKDDEILLYRVRDIDTSRSLWQRRNGNHSGVRLWEYDSDYKSNRPCVSFPGGVRR